MRGGVSRERRGVSHPSVVLSHGAPLPSTSVPHEDPGSFREIEPPDRGGVVSRRGLSFQDHVAAAFCLEMLEDTGPDEVWCETLDDILLYWAPAGCVEYVQAKTSSTPEWTVAKACARTNGKHGTSLIEQSLLRDRARERSLFRIVTTRNVGRDLEALVIGREALGRTARRDDFIALATRIEGKLGKECVSANGNGIKYWVDNCQWEVKHDETAVRDFNLLQIERVAEDHGVILTTDQTEEIYKKLLRKVYDAALARHTDLEKKRILRAEMRSWLSSEFVRATSSWGWRPGGELAKKLAAAGVAPTEIEGASQLRRKYRAERLRPRYVDSRRLGDLEVEIEAELRVLRSRVDAGTLPDHGLQIHSQSLECVTTAMKVLELAGAPKYLGQGFMYELADRCVHRFRRARPS